MSATRIGASASPEEGGKGRPCPGHCGGGLGPCRHPGSADHFRGQGTHGRGGQSAHPCLRVAAVSPAGRTVHDPDPRQTIAWASHRRRQFPNQRAEILRCTAPIPAHLYRRFCAAWTISRTGAEPPHGPGPRRSRYPRQPVCRQTARGRDLPWNGLQAREIVMELSEKRIVIERILLAPRSRETSRVSWPSKDKASALTALRSRASSVHSSSIRLPGQNPIPIRSPIPDRDRDGGRNPFQTRTRSQRRARTS